MTITHSQSSASEGSTHSQTPGATSDMSTLSVGGSAGFMSGPSRYGVVAPIAAGVTLGLLLSMATMVAAEFEPQDKTKSMTFEINPVPDDLPPAREIPKPDPLKDVEVPPPPPELDIVKVAEVVVPKVPFGGTVPDIDPFEIEFDSGLGDIIVADGEEQPIVRIPPIFPPRFLQGDNSGYCKMRFDVSAQGLPYNVQAVSCTNRLLSSPSIETVQKWKYKAKVQNGQPVDRPGLETTIRFELTDERGRLLPMPNGV